MRRTEELYFTNRKDWRTWLAEHYDARKEVWLVYYNKNSGRPSIPYGDSVEEALCFGWIDSTVKRLDADHSAQRFSQRNPNSPYSQTNKERLRWLIEHNQVMPDILASLDGIITEEFEIPADILQALQANEQAWRNFQQFSGPYQRIRVAYVDGARKRPAEFQKRLKNFIHMMEQNKQFGYGIEKYY